jgi:hypothetical protein
VRFGIALAIAAVLGSAFAVAADDRLQWQFDEADDPASKGRKTAILTYGVPETDAIQVSGACTAASAASANVSSLMLTAETGALANGKDVDVRFSGGGVEHTVKGHVKHAEGEQGLSGVTLALEHSDPLWQLMADKETLDYLVPGYKTSTLTFKGRENIAKFVTACRTYAGLSAPPSPDAGAAAANEKTPEKDAFNSAKELGTADAWNAFLTNYPSGFHADLARAYLKKLTDQPVQAGATDANTQGRPSVIAARSSARNSGSTKEISCKERTEVRSRNSDKPANVTFVNTSGMHRAIIWLDFKGEPTDYAALNSGEQVTIDTYVTHPWMIATGPGDCLQIFMPGAGDSTVVLERVSADDPPKKTSAEKTCPKGTVLKSGSCVSTKKTPLEYARESCKETGGYWTGKTCKASKNAKQGKCQPGYAWSSDAGACQWDGGPPKKQQQPNTAQQVQQIIQGLQNLNNKKKCPPGQTWNGNICTAVDNCPGDSALNAQGKCVKGNEP